jgi:hypothetical protein
MSVINSTFETKGTNLYFVGSDGSTVFQLTCPTGITGVNGGSKDRIDTTCLSETGAFRTNIGGFADASEVAVPFILYDGDSSHAELQVLQASGEVVGWFVGLSDSTTAPTVASDGLEPPAGRTGWNFQGYVANVTFDAAINEVIRGNLTIQPSGSTYYHAAV